MVCRSAGCPIPIMSPGAASTFYERPFASHSRVRILSSFRLLWLLFQTPYICTLSSVVKTSFYSVSGHLRSRVTSTNVVMAMSLVMNAITTTMPVERGTLLNSVEVKDPRQQVPISDPRLEPVPKKRRLYRVDAEEIRPGGQLYDRWLGTIRQQIHMDMEPARDQIKAQCNGKSSEETTFNYNLFMAGRAAPGATEILLTPCVWFFCGSKWCKRIVKKVMKDLKWLRSWGIGECEAEVGGPIFLASYVNDQTFYAKLRHLDLDLVNGVQLPNGFTAYLHLNAPWTWGSVVSAMGLLCCSTLTRNEKIVSRKLSRVGGVVYAQRRNGGLDAEEICLGVTTAHNLAEAWLEGSATERSTPQGDELDSSDESEDDTSSDEELSDCGGESSLQTNRNHWLKRLRRRSSSTSNTKAFATWWNVSGNMAGNFLGTVFGSLHGQSSNLDTTIMDLTPVQISDVLVFQIPGYLHYLRLKNYYDTSPFQDTTAIDRFYDFVAPGPSGLPDMEAPAKVFVIKDQMTAISAEVIPETFQLCVRGESLETTRLKVSKPLRKS